MYRIILLCSIEQNLWLWRVNGKQDAKLRLSLEDKSENKVDNRKYDANDSHDNGKEHCRLHSCLGWCKEVENLSLEAKLIKDKRTFNVEFHQGKWLMQLHILLLQILEILNGIFPECRAKRAKWVKGVHGMYDVQRNNYVLWFIN